MSQTIKAVLGISVIALVCFGLYLFLSGNKNQAAVQPNPTSPGSNNTSRVLVKGTAKATGQAAEMAKQITTVYVILKNQGGGPPYAVKKISNSGMQTEVSFELTESDVMIPGRPAPQNPVLKVRFDSDGNASTENPSDPVGELTGFQLGSEDLEVTLSFAGGE